MSRELIIDTAPGKELIPLIGNAKSASPFTEFYNMRKLWCKGYPLIHDRMVTYGFLDDVWFIQDTKRALYETATEIALRESDEFFHCALCLKPTEPDESYDTRVKDLML
jgi:hypothetical protein